MSIIISIIIIILSIIIIITRVNFQDPKNTDPKNTDSKNKDAFKEGSQYFMARVDHC